MRQLRTIFEITRAMRASTDATVASIAITSASSEMTHRQSPLMAKLQCDCRLAMSAARDRADQVLAGANCQIGETEDLDRHMGGHRHLGTRLCLRGRLRCGKQQLQHGNGEQLFSRTPLIRHATGERARG